LHNSYIFFYSPDTGLFEGISDLDIEYRVTWRNFTLW